ncbi:MAG TPA: hypothetical protein P5181_14140 [Dermatophilaceae bacterium]|nr:hypothetical protein [Dermatophilaceae bacterium]
MRAWAARHRLESSVLAALLVLLGVAIAAGGLRDATTLPRRAVGEHVDLGSWQVVVTGATIEGGRRWVLATVTSTAPTSRPVADFRGLSSGAGEILTVIPTDPSVAWFAPGLAVPVRAELGPAGPGGSTPEASTVVGLRREADSSGPLDLARAVDAGRVVGEVALPVAS